MRQLVLGIVVGAVVAGSLALVASRRSDGDRAQPTLAERAAKNYRVLSKTESRVLVRYAERVYRCVVARGAKVGAPVASSTRIRMAAETLSADELLRYLTACDPEVGPPPPRSSLQARNGQILVYLPKQCLLDPTEVDPV